MELTGKDIEEFGNTADEVALRKYALITAQILNKTQLKALQRYFSRPIVLNVPEGKATPEAAEMRQDANGEEEVEASVDELLNEAREVIDEPTKPAPDFGFGDVPRPRGRPPMTARERAEKEFDEIMRRRNVA